MTLTIVVFVVTALVLVGTVAYMSRQRTRNTLNAKRFALAVTAGWGSAIAIFYFLGLSLASDIELTTGLVGLGLGIVYLNLILGYPASIFVYRRMLLKVLPEGKPPPDSP